MTGRGSDRTIKTVGTTAYTTEKASSKFNSLTWDITGALKDDEDKIATVILYATNAAGCYIKNPAVTVEYVPVGASLYNVSFTDYPAGAKIVVDGNDVTNGTTLADGTYSYTATAVGYKKTTGTFTVAGKDLAVKVEMEAMPAVTAPSIPEDAVATTTYADAYTANASGDIGGNDTYGEGYTWYATMDFILNPGGNVNYTGKGNNAQGTSVDFNENEIRYYTSSSGTQAAGNVLSANTWYRVVISCDTSIVLSADHNNAADTLHFVVTNVATGEEVASFDTGFRNANKGLKNITVSSGRGDTVANVYSYFIADPTYSTDYYTFTAAEGSQTLSFSKAILTATNAEGKTATSEPVSIGTAVTLEANASFYLNVTDIPAGITINSITVE